MIVTEHQRSTQLYWRMLYCSDVAMPALEQFGLGACLHEVVIVGHLPALPAQLQAASHLQFALPVHDGDAASYIMHAVGHILHHLPAPQI